MIFRITGLRYARLAVRDLDAAAGFATRITGLQEAGRMGSTPGTRAVYLKSDARHHSLVYFEGDPAMQCLGFEVADTPAQLKAAAGELTARGVATQLGTRDECALRNVSAMAWFTDPSGNRIELVVPARDTDAPFAPTRLAGLSGLGLAGLCSTDPARDEAFWTGMLGAAVSDRVGTSPMLRFNEQHHQIMLLPARHPGIQHLGIQVGSIDDVMRSWYFLRDNGVRIPFGPGREPTSSAVFIYFDGPEGMVFKYYAAGRTIRADTNARPRHFPFAPRSFCMWGGRPDMPEFNPQRP